ncbi:MAG: DHHA1 domain-containing protein [Sulfolobales archaeon]|nr:DHHA1 domain-containing protein [Sulfolobales archaeon]
MGSDACIVTHTDLDGVASAALVLKHLRMRGINDVEMSLTQPHNLYTAIKKIKCDELYICDLGINHTTYHLLINEVDSLRKSGVTLYWFDHHIWQDSWVAHLTELGVNLHVDVGTCTAGVVARVLKLEDDNSLKLVKATCSNDLWIFNDYLGNYLSRYVVCKPGNKWRKQLINKLIDFDGILSDELIKCAENVIDRDLKVFKSAIKNSFLLNVGGIKVAITMKEWEESSTSFVAHYIMSRLNADVVIVFKEGSLSIRSNELNIRELAVRLGGGGHPKAAGAPFKLPILYRFLIALGIRKPVLRYCGKVIANELTNLNLSKGA